MLFSAVKWSFFYFTAETRVCFRYYHGNTGQLHAYTQSILVRNPTASSSHGVSFNTVCRYLYSMFHIIGFDFICWLIAEYVGCKSSILYL